MRAAVNVAIEEEQSKNEIVASSREKHVYSARTRGARNDENLKTEVPEDHCEESARKATVSWARGMKRIFNVDPLICPRCGETMKIKAFLSDSREIERLCSNLGIEPWRAPPPFAKASLVA